MREEMTIRENDLKTRFCGELDLVTYAPYRVGDKVVRCGSCRRVVKTEFITANRCPLCAHTPFLPAPVDPVSGTCRSLSAFLWLLVLSVAAAWIPYIFFGAAGSLNKALFGAGNEISPLYTGMVSLIAAIILYRSSRSRRIWQGSRRGWLLVLIPAAAPYLILASIRVILFLISFAVTKGIAVISVIFVISFLGYISE